MRDWTVGTVLSKRHGWGQGVYLGTCNVAALQASVKGAAWKAAGAESIQVLTLNGRHVSVHSSLWCAGLWDFSIFIKPELHHPTPTQVSSMSIVCAQSSPSHVLLSQEFCWESGEDSVLSFMLTLWEWTWLSLETSLNKMLLPVILEYGPFRFTVWNPTAKLVAFLILCLILCMTSK